MVDYLEQIKEYAEKENVPIMTEETIDYIKKYIKKNKIKNILEIGTAIGYSAIEMALVDKKILITTIERDEKRYLEAVKNIKKLKLDNRIKLIYKDALEVEIKEKYDLIIIDAAKAQNKNFFIKYKNNLQKDGTIITDNLKFHGLVEINEEDIKSRNVRGLVRKIKEYIKYLKENEEYTTEFLEIGDGIAITKKNKVGG